MDPHKLAQLSGIFAGMGQAQATFNPVQRSLTDYLQGSAQSAIQAEAQKKAEKKAKKKDSGLGSILGGVASIAAAPFTGGASLAYLPAAMSAGSAIDSAVAGDMGGAINNATNAAGGAYGAYSADRMPMQVPQIQVPSIDDRPSAMLGEPIGMDVRGRADQAYEKAAALAPGNAVTGNRSDTWANMGGSAMNRSQAMMLATMKPRELRRYINSTPSAEQALMQYLQAGGTLTKQQMRSLPPSTKSDLRNYGYLVPGPFGMSTF